MDEVKLTLISLENEVNALDDNITKNIRKELNFLRKDLENLEDNINELKDAWELIQRLRKLKRRDRKVLNERNKDRW